jgi:hypothetical protein
MQTVSTGGTIMSVTMEDSDAGVTDRCVAQKGEFHRGRLAYTARKATATLGCEIFGAIGGVLFPFETGCLAPDTCASLATGSCGRRNLRLQHGGLR